MPINPMQRRARNSFLIGFLVALVIMAIFVLMLLYKIKNINEALEQLKALQSDVYVAATDLESGEKITMSSFTTQKVQSTVDPTQIVSDDDFTFYDDEGSPIIKYNEDGSEKEKEMVMKINVPAGTIVTKDMIIEAGKETTSDQRIQEYNMILLPSQLKAGDYIDIRFALPKGQDYIVIAKKQVLQCTETGIWLKMSEDELLTLENAIVEAWTISGSKLYAIEYAEAGLQEAAEPTYPVSADVLALINSDPNILQSAKDALWNRYYANDQAQAVQRNNNINTALQDNIDSLEANVQAGNQDENSKIQEARSAYVSALDGE